MGKTYLWFSTVIILILLTTLFLSQRKYALDEANHQATVRLLSQFHKKFIHSKGINKDDYMQDLHRFNLEHSQLLDEYIRNLVTDDAVKRAIPLQRRIGGAFTYQKIPNTER